MAANTLQLPQTRGRHHRQQQSKDGGKNKSEGRILKIVGDTSSAYKPLPVEHQNLKVQESDGNFFESFTALSWRQQNKRLRATNEDDKDLSKPPPHENQFVSKVKLPQLSRKEFELLYIEVLYTIKHKIGITIGGHLPFIQDLYQYAQEAFRVSPEDHARLLAQATKEKPPIVILNVTILEARNLEAKDADGFSDPYCMLGIIPGRLLYEGSEGGSFGSSDEENNRSRDRDRGFKKFSIKKKDRSSAVRDLLPAKYIQTTSVIPNTLNPVWSEKFRFDLEDPQSDRIHLDIWDHDDEFSVIEAAKKLNEVQGFKGLGRYFKQVAQSARTRKSSGSSVDDFLGCVTIQIDDTPSSGQEKWYQLEGRSSKSSVDGQIKIRLSLATREDRGIPEDDNWTDVRQHEDLMCILIEHELRRSKDASYKWSGELPEAAETIIHQHAIQGDITPVQQAVCRWMAYTRKHLEHPLDYQLLLSLLQKLDKLWEPTSLSREEEECLAESFGRFIDHCLCLLRRQRDAFPTNNRQAMQRLEAMLRCLAQIYASKVFRRICPFQKELHPEVTAVVKKSSQEWYEKVHARCRQHTRVDNEEDVIQSLLEVTNQLNVDMHHSIIFYTRIFEQILEIQYFRITYQQVEKMLAADVQSSLQDEFGDDVVNNLKTTLARLENTDTVGEASEQQSLILTMGTQLFELYLALQEFCQFKEHLPTSVKKDLAICDFYQWFAFAVQKWLHIARHKAYKRIHKAVELDKNVDIKNGVKYSTSAVDVCCCFSQITEFWKNLDWPDPVDAHPMVQKLTSDICGGAVLYAELIHDKLRQAGYYDEEGQFDVTEQLCITINNIEQVRKSLTPVPEMLQFNEIQTALEAENTKSKCDLMAIMNKADKGMISKIKQVVDRVADKMRPDIKKDVFHLNWAPEAVPADDAIGDLLEYLDSNLLTLNNNLLKANFDRILESIWVECLEEFYEALQTEEPKAPIFYQRMYDALGLLVQFFNANDKGLLMQNILCPMYKDLKKDLGLHKMDTSSLIEAFYEEKLTEQREYTGTEFGTLSVRVWYKQDTTTMLVEVLNAKDIIPLDANGLSDPYVVVAFCPEHMFPTVPQQTTKIIKKTLNPEFDESFEFNVSVTQCRKKGAALVFTVMDHDYVFENDFAGEVYLPLAEIPGVDGDEVTGYEALSVISLPLMQPTKRRSGPLAILSRRVWDKQAQDFVKLRSKVQEQST